MRVRLLVISCIAASACTPLPSYRYKLTVEVETPEGLRTGSSVIEVQARAEAKLLPDMQRISATVAGEAVAVPLPGGRVLFAVLYSDSYNGHPERIARAALLKRHPLQDSEPEVYARQAERLGSFTVMSVVPQEAYPIFVTFGDLIEPQTVNWVDPSNLGATFGEGYRIRELKIQTTQTEVTSDLVRWLPWTNSDVRMTVKDPDGPYYDISSEHFRRNLRVR